MRDYIKINVHVRYPSHFNALLLIAVLCTEIVYRRYVKPIAAKMRRFAILEYEFYDSQPLCSFGNSGTTIL